MKKILVVDDEKPISDIIKFNLEKEGYEIVTAFDGEEALEKVNQFDIETLNGAIKDLSEVVEPMAKFFNVFNR